MDRRRAWTLGVVAAAAVVAVIVFANLGKEAPGEASVGLDPVLGSGDLVVFLFEDYQCPHCRDYALSPEYEALIGRWVETDRIQLVFKHAAFVNARFDSYSMDAAVASRCVFQVDPASWPAWDHAVYADQLPPEPQPPTREHVRALAGEQGIDLAAYDDCMASPEEAEQAVRDNQDELAALGKGTPTLLVDGRTFNPHAEAGAVDAAIAEALGAEG